MSKNDPKSYSKFLREKILASCDRHLISYFDALDPPSPVPQWEPTTFPMVPESNIDTGIYFALSDRFIGIPNIGVVEMGDHAYEQSDDLRNSFSNDLIEEYLPEALDTVSRSYLPSFSIGGRGIGVEENWQKKGPLWSEEEISFTFVLAVDTRTDSKKILYGEDLSFLIWAGINYVYAEFDLNRFYDEFFGTIIL